MGSLPTSRAPLSLGAPVKEPIYSGRAERLFRRKAGDLQEESALLVDLHEAAESQGVWGLCYACNALVLGSCGSTNA